MLLSVKRLDFFHFDYYISILYIPIVKFSNAAAYIIVNDVPVDLSDAALNFLLQPLLCELVRELVQTY